MGISPVHFSGAFGQDFFPFTNNSCNDLWPRYSWQAYDRVSHEELARVIYDAEQDIARALGYYPAPWWIGQEVHKFPRHYRPEIWAAGGKNVRGDSKSIVLDYGKFIQGGQRAVTLVGTATVGGGTLVYSDEDGDGWNETATITLPTAVADVCQIKIYQEGEGGSQSWEIRPARSKTITGGNFVGVYDAWLFINPDLQSAYPTVAGFAGIDITTTANYVTAVDVYREYNDFTATAATMFWEPLPHSLIVVVCPSCAGLGCPACSLASQTGCLHVRDTEMGAAVAVPGTYNATTGQWEAANYAECRDPDEISVYYYAGNIDNEWRRDTGCEMLSNYWAHAIAWMATARLERQLCSCTNVTALAEQLREDLALNTAGRSHNMDFNLLGNPFGTRRGEIQAWLRVRKFGKRRMYGGIA
jgi:hypothetical protein